MMTTFIYALCAPDTGAVRYIGKSDNPERRFKYHLSTSVKRKSYLGNWLRSLAEEPNLVILREVLSDAWQEAERKYIRIAKGLGMKLVNTTEGGEGVSKGSSPSAETRIKMSMALTGRKFSPEHRAKLSKAHFGKTLSPETRAKIRHAQLGKTHTSEARAKMSAARLGRKLSTETRAKMRAARLGRKLSPIHRARLSYSAKTYWKLHKTGVCLPS